MQQHARKRSRDEFELDRLPSENTVGLAQTLSRLKGGDPNSLSKAADEDVETRSGWQAVNSKRTKSSESSKSKDNYPTLEHSPQARLERQLGLSDLQSLVLYLLADEPAPRWIAVRHGHQIRKVVVLMVPGLERGMFDGSIPLANSINDTDDHSNDSNSTHTQTRPQTQLSPDDYYPFSLNSDQIQTVLKPLSTIFQHVWPIKTPGDDRQFRMHSPLAAMLVSPLPKSRAYNSKKGVKPPREAQNWDNQPTPITHFLASVEHLRENDYVIHDTLLKYPRDKQLELEARKGKEQTSEQGWIDSVADFQHLDGSSPATTSPIRTPSKPDLTAGRPVMALDCEMCQTGPDRFELTRISLVSWDGSILLDELVKPPNPITDYLTRFSGITKEKLDPITTTLEDIQRRLLGIITPLTVLIGHSLNSDLTALKLCHPAIVDTSLIYPHPRGPPLRSSLKWLAQKYLQREIQTANSGHDSVEDARTALDLVKLKCQRGPKWGTVEATTESIFKRISRSSKPNDSSSPRNGAVVDWGFPKRGYGATSDIAIGCENDNDVVAAVKRAVLGDPDGAVVPGGGVDFVWARLRELEAFRGWWNTSKTADNETLLENATSQSDNRKGVAQEEKGSKPILTQMVETSSRHIQEIYEALPPCTAFIVYSGSGDPAELARLQTAKQAHQKEYQVKKWDECSRWTDADEEALKAAAKKARQGIAFLTVK